MISENMNLFSNYYENNDLKDITVGIIKFPEKISRNRMRRIAHEVFRTSIQVKYDLFQIKLNEVERNILYGYTVKNARKIRIAYSFSYVEGIATFIYSDIYNVSLDIENPYKVEPLDVFLFRLDREIYRKMELYEYGIKTLSWCLQEAIGKLERTGLDKKHVISNVEKKKNHFILNYYQVGSNEVKYCNMLISKINDFYLIINYRRI
ncbi:hypothetical protein ACQPU1_14420 [Clostridium paraputrificum]|uniref:hypothetical protein n=1 Tax=Clostridium TaxID=1485 RepID=UPI003D339243